MNLPFTKTEPAAGSGLAEPDGRLPAPDRPTAMPKAGRFNRVIAAVVTLVAGGFLSLAASLSPDARGYGTHQQLGLPACSSELLAGRPCPTCGMTTAFAWFIRGELRSALRAQVLGTVLAAVTLLAALGGAVMAVTGIDFGPLLWRVFVERLEWLYLLIILGLGSWALKMYTA